MTKRISPIFVTAGAVIGLACFILLSMLFYAPVDYFERAGEVAASKGGGFRFDVAATFFKPFGVGAYIGWAIVLLWAVIVFFKESVGDLALRAVSLAVVVVSGASVAHLLGAGHLGGHLGYTFGSFLQAAFGGTLGVIVMGAIFAVSFLLATDFGFITYFREARAALAVAEPEVEEEEDDLARIIERTAREVEAETEADTSEEAPEEPELLLTKPTESRLPPDVEVQKEEEPLVLDLRPKIEEESLDEDLLVTEKEEPPEAERTEDSERPEESSELAAATAELEAALEARRATPADAEPETAGIRRDPIADLDSVFDALVGLSREARAREDEPLPVIEIDDEPISEEEIAEETVETEVEPDAEMEAEEPRFVLDDEIVISGPEEVAEPEPEPTAEAAPSPEPEPVEEPEAESPSVILVDDVIPVGVEEPEGPMLPFMESGSDEEPAGEPHDEVAEIPVLKDVREEPGRKKSGVFKSLFTRRKEPAERRDQDPLLEDAARLVIDRGRASVVLLQRRLDIGYTRASRLVEAMEREGLVGPLEESGSREVRMSPEEWERHLEGTDGE